MAKHSPHKQDSIVKPLIQSVISAQERWNLFPCVGTGTPQTLVVGVSGGADSVCLLHVLLQLRERWQLDLQVAHLDHALRPDSGNDAEFVQQLCNRWRIPYHVQRVLPGVIEECTKLYGSVEAACRFERYEFLCTVVQKVAGQVAGQVAGHNRSTALALAHHADDQAETVLFRLIRGSGLHGLGGIRPLTFYPHSEQYVRVVRPLIDVRQTEIIRYLNEHKLEWRADSTNRNLAFARNRLRHLVFPELQKINARAVEAITRTAAILAESAARLDGLDQTLLASIRINPIDRPRTVLDLDKWLVLTPAEQRATLRIAVGERLRSKRNIEQIAEETGFSEEASFEQIETLRQQVLNARATAKPRSLIGNLKWSLLAKTDEHPRQLVLHDAIVNPCDPGHPHLGDGLAGTAPLDFSLTTLPVSLYIGGWHLRCTVITKSDVPASWQQNQDPWQAWIDLDIAPQLALTTPKNGQKFSPLGMDGQQKMLGDFFTDRKVAKSLRAGWPIVINRVSDKNHETHEVIWVCGHMIAHPARVTDNTSRILHMRWQLSGESVFP